MQSQSAGLCHEGTQALFPATQALVLSRFSASRPASGVSAG